MGERDDHARKEVERVVVAEPGRLRRASGVAVLSFLSAAALAPAVVALADGGAVAAAVGSMAGNIGAGPVSDFLTQVGRTLRRGRSSPPTVDEARSTLDAALNEALARQDALASEMKAVLLAHLARIGALDAAAAAAGDDVRPDLVRALAEIQAANDAVLDRLGLVASRQRQQARTQHQHMALTQEALDLVREALQRLSSAPAPTVPSAGAVIATPVIVPAGRSGTEPIGWVPGAEHPVGDRRYMLHDHRLAERRSPDGSFTRREGRAVRTVPAPHPDGSYVWLRQVHRRRSAAAADEAVAALDREHALLSSLRVAGVPKEVAFVRAGDIATLVLAWPASQASHGPCGTLDELVAPPPIADDPWHHRRALAGLAGLCGTLDALHRQGASHRDLSPEAIVLLDDGRLALRDLGLAGLAPGRGDGPRDHRAPEQARAGAGEAGAATDVYQVGSIAYRLLTGHLPASGRPVPIDALARSLPTAAAQGIDAALDADPAGRPSARSLRVALSAR